MFFVVAFFIASILKTLVFFNYAQFLMTRSKVSETKKINSQLTLVPKTRPLRSYLHSLLAKERNSILIEPFFKNVPYEIIRIMINEP